MPQNWKAGVNQRAAGYNDVLVRYDPACIYKNTPCSNAELYFLSKGFAIFRSPIR